MTKKTKSILIIIISMLIVLAFIISKGVFGVSANSIEQDARKSQKIDSTWEVSKSINDRLSAMIFYNDTCDYYTYSIYINRNGFSFGYFFRAGGSDSIIMNGIHEFTYDTNASALISINKDKVAKIKLNDGIKVTQIDISPNKPFAVVIPINCDSITLYDVNGSIVPITEVEVSE